MILDQVSASSWIPSSEQRKAREADAASERFAEVVEMLHSNKVNKTNAFQFRIADFISNFFKASASTDIVREFVWQRYSSGIDSCAKIYGFCVDFVYSEAFKVLGGVNRSNIVEDSEEPEEKKKKRSNAGVATLERNAESITTNKFEFATSFDPYYKQLSAAFDSAGSRGLLLGSLRINDSLELMLSSEDKLHQEVHMDVEGEVSIRHLLPPLEKLPLCKELEKYAIDVVASDSQTLADGPIISQIGADWELQSEKSGDEMPLDFDIEEEAEDEARGVFKAVTLEDRLSCIVERDDYQYFNNPRLSSWAGFEFWNKRNMIAPTKTVERRKRKEPMRILLDADVIEDPALVMAKPSRGGRKTMTEGQRPSLSELNLPDDYEVSLKRLTQLFTRPQSYIKKLDEKNDVLIDYSNENQPEPHEDADVLFANPVDVESIPAPQEALQFAKTSKRVDVKLLKDTIWKDLQLVAPGKENAVEGGKSHTFMNVLEKLPMSLPQSELENLSMHSCFITLLHLANEHSKT